ncbi:hypothetical protein HX017_09570 [Myroides marinus]|uniref:hypothetical protein n=2 Tax=Myroides marinus TaxID=703342 RepID=UPI00257556BA|nr:hypothetical protein [Myroides marinus]MDM1350554.1 hypothetical protein [Myroides marinus]MDM1355759.1 hypothetical protein [Myroides marinus]MDM1365196.1 hypothetical protein [Myroides marinus]MDM1532912.1 hypothetical protein [Myroides marinus]MDM1539874.1 hypothetical protein [Myroides marinus]
MNNTAHNKITTQMRILALCQVALVGLFIYHLVYGETYFVFIFVDAFIFIMLSGYIRYLLIVKQPNSKRSRPIKKK